MKTNRIERSKYWVLIGIQAGAVGNTKPVAFQNFKIARGLGL